LLSFQSIEHEHISYDEDEPFVVNYQICTDKDAAEKDENKDIKIKIETSTETVKRNTCSSDRCHIQTYLTGLSSYNSRIQ
jgi:hypothetical protein